MKFRLILFQERLICKLMHRKKDLLKAPASQLHGKNATNAENGMQCKIDFF